MWRHSGGRLNHYRPRNNPEQPTGTYPCSGEHCQQIHQPVLDGRGLILASNQIGYILLNLRPESSGVLQACGELDVSVISFGPLLEGLLAGKYGNDTHPPLLVRLHWACKRLGSLDSLRSLMKDIASGHSASQSQIALNWLISKGTLPIPGVKSEKQAADNAATMRWELNGDKVEALDTATARYLG